MGTNAVTKTTVDRTVAGGEPKPERSVVYLPIVIRVMLIVSVALILLGTVIALFREGALPTPVISFTDLPPMLISLDAAALITLGVLVCLITPPTFILYMGISYARARDRLYTLIAGIVFCIIVGSIIVTALSGASDAIETNPVLSLGNQFGILVVSAVAGVLGSMLGLGGGVFIVPVVSVFFGVPLKVTIAASAVSVVVNSLGGTSVYLKHDMSNVRLGLVMELTTAVGAIAGSLIVVAIAPDALRVIFGVALLAMGIAMFLRQSQAVAVTSGPDPLRLRQVFHDPSTNETIEYIPQQIKLGIAASSVAGIISGMLGIGGGAVKVPILNGVMRVPVKAAAATSVFMVGITVSVSAFIYYLHNIIDLSVTVPAVLGVLIGSQTGARVSRHLKNAVLIRFLVLILIYLAVTLLLQAFGVNLPGTSAGK